MNLFIHGNRQVVKMLVTGWDKSFVHFWHGQPIRQCICGVDLGVNCIVNCRFLTA